MPSWRELEKVFQELHKALQYSRINYQWGEEGEYFHFTGTYNPQFEKKFENLACIAGEKLMKSPAIPEYKEVLREPNPLYCWYKGLRYISGLFEYEVKGQKQNSEVNNMGSIYNGSIVRVAEASSVLCLKMEQLN
jgi:hypothetical protein